MTSELLSSLPAHTLAFVAAIIASTLIFHIRFTEKAAAYAPTILTTTGIFATFMGIALGLSHFDPGNIQASVPSLLSGLKTAFWASVFGVGGALTIKFRHFILGARDTHEGSGADGEITAADIASLLKGIQQALVGSEEATLVSQIKLLRQDANDRLDTLGRAQQEALHRLSEMGSKALVEALRDVIRDFNAKISEQFGENFKALNEAVGALLTWQRQYKEHIEHTTARQAEIVESMNSASEQYRVLVDRASGFSDVAESLSALITSLETQKQQLVSVLTDLSRLLQAASGSLPEIEAKVLTITDQLSNAIAANQNELGRALQENSHLLGSSVEASARALSTSLTENQKEVSKALAENVLLIRNSIQSAGQDFARINTDFNKHLSDMAGKTREQVAVLDAALSEELTKSLESLGRQLAALSERFVSDYTPLTDRLRHLVAVAGR